MITQQQRKALLFIEVEMERIGGVAPFGAEIAEPRTLRRGQQEPIRRI